MINLTTQHVRSKFKHLGLKELRPEHLLRSAFHVIKSKDRDWTLTHRGESITSFAADRIIVVAV